MIDMELGPIRPPSEAESLMLRVTRGCHWNKCYFCDLYKKYKFSRRRYEEIEEDLKKAADSEYAQNYTTCFLQDGDEHIVNLLLEVRGNIRTDKQNMLETINTYLQLPKQEQELFNLGRRLNIMFFLADLNNRAKRKQTEEGLRKIKTQNPDLDLAFVCNYVRQTQI